MFVNFLKYGLLIISYLFSSVTQYINSSNICWNYVYILASERFVKHMVGMYLSTGQHIYKICGQIMKMLDSSKGCFFNIN